MDKADIIRTGLAQGKTLKEIGRSLGGVSRQRVYQLMDRYSIETPEYKRKGFVKAQGDEFKWLQRTMCSRGITVENRLEIHKKFEKGFPTHCPILGLPLVYGNAIIRNEDSASLDQICPGKGYVADNIAIISWRANRIKNDGTAEEHEKIAAFLRQHT